LTECEAVALAADPVAARAVRLGYLYGSKKGFLAARSRNRQQWMTRDHARFRPVMAGC
jgi:hypothetical protein